MNIQEDYYSISHKKQLSELFKNGYYSQIIHQTTELEYLIPSLIGCRMYDESTITLIKKEQKDPLTLMWMIAGSHMIGMHSEKREEALKEAKNTEDIELLEDFLKNVSPFSHPKEIKFMFRNKFEKLVEAAENNLYFAMKNMPVFLIPKKWIQSFYDDAFQLIPSIDTRQLVEPMPYIDRDPKYMHLNYKLKESCRENTDFKIISYEAWQLLKTQFGGVELRRFNSPGTESSCELWFREIRVIVSSNRYIHTNWEMPILASRYDTIGSVVERVKRILLEYQMIEKDDVSKKWEAIKVSYIPTQKLVNILLNEEKQLFLEHEKHEGAKLQRMEFRTLVQESQMYLKNDILLLALNPEQSFIDLKRISFMKLAATEPQPIAKTTEKCKLQTAEENRLNKLFDLYSVQRQVFQWDEIKSIGRVGFQNLGNTCYFNAALQCVLSIDKFNKYFVSNLHLKDINVMNVLGSEGYLACAYGQLVKQYYSCNRRAIEPSKVLRIIAKNNQFRGHNQQDSQEFLNYFLDKLHEDLNQIKKKPYLEDIQSNGRPDEIVSKESWENYLKRNKSFISDSLAGQYRSEISCPDCDRISITFDPFLSATIPFPANEQKEELKGYFLNQEGEFMKVIVKIKPSMNTQTFLKKSFSEQVVGEWLIQKKPAKKWNPSKTISQNNSQKGILLFYYRPEQANIEINYEIQGYSIFNRRMYHYNIDSQEELIKKMCLNIKKPFIKALKQEDLLTISNQDYLKKCEELKFIELISTSHLEYPLKQGVYNFEIKINEEKLNDWKLKNPIKFDVSSKTYPLKQKIKFRSIDESIPVSELLESFKVPEKLTQENAWYCNKCRDHKLAEKKMEIYKVPEYLIIHLKRFNHRGNRYIIYGEKVRTPVQIQNYQVINGKEYELIGTVNHFGTMSYGHYTAYGKRNDQWYYFDDSSVRKSKPTGSDAYLLFYKQVQS